MAFVGKSLISTVPKPRVLLSDVWELSQWLIACFMLSWDPKLMVDGGSPAHLKLVSLPDVIQARLPSCCLSKTPLTPAFLSLQSALEGS